MEQFNLPQQEEEEEWPWQKDGPADRGGGGGGGALGRHIQSLPERWKSTSSPSCQRSGDSQSRRRAKDQHTAVSHLLWFHMTPPAGHVNNLLSWQTFTSHAVLKRFSSTTTNCRTLAGCPARKGAGVGTRFVLDKLILLLLICNTECECAATSAWRVVLF